MKVHENGYKKKHTKLVAHSRPAVIGLDVIVKNQLPYGENEWGFYFWKLAVALYTWDVSIREKMVVRFNREANEEACDESEGEFRFDPALGEFL